MMVADPVTTPVPRPRPRVGAFAGFAAATLALISGAAAALTLVFTGPGDARAIWISAAVAAFSQIVPFPLVRRLTAQNLMVGWGTGSLIRFGTLGLYALIAALVLDLPMTAALVSLALFYFVSMVIEPLFLRK